MTAQTPYTTETVEDTLVVTFHQPSLVFPDQLAPIESQLKASRNGETNADACSQNVVFDLSNVTHISSSVWGGLILLNKSIRENGHKMAICCLNENLTGALEAMKLEQILTVYPSRQAALK